LVAFSEIVQSPTTTDDAMRRLADTTPGASRSRMPSGSRFAYSLSPNDPQTFDPPRASQRDATVQ